MHTHTHTHFTSHRSTGEALGGAHGGPAIRVRDVREGVQALGSPEFPPGHPHGGPPPPLPCVRQEVRGPTERRVCGSDTRSSLQSLWLDGSALAFKFRPTFSPTLRDPRRALVLFPFNGWRLWERAV